MIKGTTAGETEAAPKNKAEEGFQLMGMRRVRNEGRGDCLFLAILDQIDIGRDPLGTTEAVLRLRNEACDAAEA